MSDVVEIVLRGRGPNTLSLESLEELDRAIRDAPNRTLLIRGDGDAFSAGLDLDALQHIDMARLIERLEAAVERLFLHPAPTVACVNGHAIAGGCLLAVACDHRVASADPAVRIGMTAVKLGLTYPPLVLRVLRARIPQPALSRILLGAHRFGTAEALASGVFDELSDAPLERARAVAERLSSHPRGAYRETKLALRAGALEVSEEARARFEERGAPAWTEAVERLRER